MSTSKTWPGGATGATATAYSIPAAGELNWAGLSNFLIALADGAQCTTFQKQAVRKAVTTPITVADTDCTVVSDLTTPAAVAVTLPAGADKQVFHILDGKGDATTNNVTITPDGSDTIAGSATFVLSNDSEGVSLIYNLSDTDWKITGRWNQAGTSIGGFTADKVMVSDGSGNLTTATTSTTQVDYLQSATGTTGTASTNLVFSTSPTFITPLLGTPTSGVLTNCTGLVLTTGVTGTLPVLNGGTGVTTSTGTTNVVLSAGPTITSPTFSGTITLSSTPVFSGAVTFSGGAISLDNAVTINDSGADVDFRVEGDTDTALLVCDAGDDRVAIGSTGASSAKFYVNADTASSLGYVDFSNPNDSAGAAIDLRLIASDNGTGTYSFDIAAYRTGTTNIVNNATTPITDLYTAAIKQLTLQVGSVVVNEDGAAIDFRVEGDTETNLLICDGSSDRVGIGQATPSHKLVLEGTTANVASQFRITSTGVASAYQGCDSTGFHIGTDTGKIAFKTGVSAGGSVTGTGTERCAINTTEMVVNDAQGNYDFRVEGDTVSHLLHTDASQDTVGIGAAATTAKLLVSGGALTHTHVTAGLLYHDISNTDTNAGSGTIFRAITDNGSGGSATFNNVCRESGTWTFDASHPSGTFIFTSTPGGTSCTIDTNGYFLNGKTATAFATAGVELRGTAGMWVTSETDSAIHRPTTDGNLLSFWQASSQEGVISVSGTTVTYGTFCGSHWAQLDDNSKDEKILRGSIMESTNKKCTWGDEANDQLVKVKVSDKEESKAVYGVFFAWDDEEEPQPVEQMNVETGKKVMIPPSAAAKAKHAIYADYNDMFVASLGAFVIRVRKGEVLSNGDFLQSAGDGTAKVQADDLMRSSTVAKVTCTEPVETFPDGSFLVPCTLHCG